MKRVLLLSSNVTVEPYPVYPLGLAVIAAALAAAGHVVEQFDFLASGTSEAELAARIAAFAPDYLCLSLRNLDNCDSLSASTGYPAIANRDWLRASAVFRKLPDLKKLVADLERRIQALEDMP